MSGLRAMCRRMVAKARIIGNFYREVLTVTDTGRQTSTPELYASGVQIRVHDSDAFTIEQYGTRGLTVSHKIFLITELDVKEGDYIDVVDSTIRYQVRGFKDASSGTKSVYQIDAEKGKQVSV